MRPANSLRITGKIGGSVYQYTAPGQGNVPDDPTGRLQIRAYVIGTNPQTPAQQERRDKFAAGVVAWHALTPAERVVWRKRGAGRGITAYNAFLSAWMKTP